MFEGADLRRAAVFHAVARAGGIAAASRMIGKSPPAIHADLRRFERDMGAVLMERSGRALRLTAAGRKMFETIGRALDEIGRVRTHLRSGDLTELALRIGAVTGFGRYRLMPRLLGVLDPDRSLLVRTGSHDDMLAALAAGRIDFAITYRPVTAVPIECETVAEEILVLAGHQARDAPTLEQLETLRFVTYEEHDYVFGRWFAEVHGRQPHMFNGGDHFEELEEALGSVRAGRGVTIAPLDACTAMGLERLGQRCSNTLYLCGSGHALASADAALIRNCLR